MTYDADGRWIVLLIVGSHGARISADLEGGVADLCPGLCPIEYAKQHFSKKLKRVWVFLCLSLVEMNESMVEEILAIIVRGHNKNLILFKNGDNTSRILHS